jgi:membrane protein
VDALLSSTIPTARIEPSRNFSANSGHRHRAGFEVGAGSARSTAEHCGQTLAGHTLFDLLRTTWHEYERDYARYFAGAMVYYALLSLVPLLLLVLAGLGLLLRFSDLAATAGQQVLLTIETNFGTELRTTIEQLLQRLQQASVVASLISLLGLVWSASVLFHHLRLSFRALWKYAPPLVSGSVGVAMRATFFERAVAFVMVLSGGVLLLTGLSLLALVQWLSGLFAGLPLVDRVPGWLLAVPSTYVMAIFTFALLFKFLPPLRLRWRDVWVAAVLCAFAWIIVTEVLLLYSLVAGDRLGAYGALGALLMFMLWMKAVSEVLFFGAELCKVVFSRRDLAEKWRADSVLARL